MALNLLPNPGNKGVKYGLPALPAEVVDSDTLSKYFVVSEFNSKFTAGKNSFQINGSLFLEPNSEILVECLDSAGENLYIEMARTLKAPAKNYAYKESTSYVLAVHVYGDTADGVGKLILYGTLRGSNKHVRWSSNISIDKTLSNVSKVRFYTRPVITIDSLQVPVVSADISNTLKQTITLTGQFHGLPVDPVRDTNYNTVNKKNVDTDYRIILDSPTIDRFSDGSGSANTQMVGSTLNLIINTIQEPFSIKNITPNNTTGSFTVKSIFNNSTIQISDPYVYTDTKKNQVVVPIVAGSYSISYPYVSYNTTTSSYLATIIDGVSTTVRQSYADITYRNIKAFSGYVARHKVYRKSLLSNADFQIVADEPLFINELLRDNLTQNKFYELLGKFYSSDHIHRYWFTSSNDITMSHTPDNWADSMKIDSPNPEVITGSSYVIVKNDSAATARNHRYKPFDLTEYLASSGSFYDSNFIPIRKDVEYILSFDSVIEKDIDEKDAKVEFYYTSSITSSMLEPTFTDKNGILLATIKSDKQGAVNKNLPGQVFFYTPKSDLFGTLTIVPYKCRATFWNMSFRVYGDDGISPDVFTTRISWPISVANESFDIKSELFDINSNLVYSELRTLQNFDASGSSLVPYIPGTGMFLPGTKDVYISGSLYVSESFFMWPNYGTPAGPSPTFYIDVLGQIHAPEMASCVNPASPATDNPISASRFVRIQGATYQHKLCRSNIVDMGHDTKYMYLSTGSMVGSIPVDTDEVWTRKAIVSEYDATWGRRIYIDGSGVVQTET